MGFEVNTDYNPAEKDFFRVEKVRMRDGSTFQGGCVMKDFQGLATLVRLPDDTIRSGESGSRRTTASNRFRDGYTEVRGGNLAGYCKQVSGKDENNVGQYSNGGICWKSAGEQTEENLLVRVTCRKVVYAAQGYGVDIVKWMESEEVKLNNGTGVRPDVVLFILESIPEMIGTHRKHGYTEVGVKLAGVNHTCTLMYRQVSGKSHFNSMGRTLTIEAIRKITRERYPWAP